MKRPMKKAVGFLTALAYSTALFCAASMTAAAEDTHGNNQGGTTADDTWNTYTTSKVLDSVNTVAVFGNQFSLYFEAADYSGTSFTFSPDTIVTMVTKDGTSTMQQAPADIFSTKATLTSFILTSPEVTV